MLWGHLVVTSESTCFGDGARSFDYDPGSGRTQDDPLKRDSGGLYESLPWPGHSVTTDATILARSRIGSSPLSILLAALAGNCN